MGMGGNGNVESHSHTSLVGTLYSANRFDLRTKSDLVIELAHCCFIVIDTSVDQTR